MKEVKCPSGAILKVGVAPFTDAKALYQALLKEAKGIAFHNKVELSSLYKDMFCAGFASAEIEKCLWKCMERCTYGEKDLKISPDSFEPVEAREDFLFVCMAVAEENVGPFVKSLYAEYLRLLARSGNSPA